MSKISKLGRILVAAGMVVLADGLNALTIDVQKARKDAIRNTGEIVTNVTFDLDLPYGSNGVAGLVKPLSVDSTNQSGIVFGDQGTIYVNAEPEYGLYRTVSGKLAVSAATWDDYVEGESLYKPITPYLMGLILDPFANRVVGAPPGNFASLDEDGDLADSGYNPGSFAPSNTVVYKVAGATNDNLAVFTADGSIKDTGVRASQFATAEQGARADRAALNIAPEFTLPPSGSFGIHEKDELRTYNGILYRCKSQHMAYSTDPTPDKDGTHWEAVTVNNSFLRVKNGVAQATGLVTSSIKIDAPSSFGDIPVTIAGGKVILYPGDPMIGSTLTIPYYAGRNGSFALLADIYAAVTNIAPAWVSGATYDNTSIVSYNGAVYACKSRNAISSAYNPASDPTNWEMKKVSDLFLPLTGGTINGSELSIDYNGPDTTLHLTGIQGDVRLENWGGEFRAAASRQNPDATWHWPGHGSSDDLARIFDIPTNVSDLNNDANYLSSESDPSVYAWAKAATKPSYTWTEINDKPTNVSAFNNDVNYVKKDDKISSFTNDVNYIKLAEFKLAIQAAVTNTIPVITDNGDGFTEEDLVKSINEIAGALNRLRNAALVE